MPEPVKIYYINYLHSVGVCDLKNDFLNSVRFQSRQKRDEPLQSLIKNIINLKKSLTTRFE